MKLVFLFLFCVSWLSAAEVRYDCLHFVEKGMSHDPRLAEERFSVEEKKLESESLFSEVILPKFSISMMVGPAPGLKKTVDDWGNTVDAWNFTELGPFWGTEIQALQPLNVGQYKIGKKALTADIRQKEMDIASKELKKEVELQSYYYNYLLALEMNRLAMDAQKQVDRAYEKLEEALDEDDESVSQMDLLKLKAGMHVVTEGVADAQSGMKQVMLAIRFSLGLAPDETFVSEDSVLVVREEQMPSLEDVRNLTLTYHPDLKRLQYGLDAKAYQMDLAKAKLAPEFFIMGEFSYVKSWASNRSAFQKNVFAQDAVNHISGSLGIGLRYRLNFWKDWEKVRKSRLEYRALKMKENYAAEGTVLLAEEQYHKTVAMKEKMDALKESLRASDAILKGAAMQYDLDPSKASDLISAYTQNVNLKKDYYMAICKYNIAIAELIARMGMHLSDYRSLQQN